MGIHILIARQTSHESDRLFQCRTFMTRRPTVFGVNQAQRLPSVFRPVVQSARGKGGTGTNVLYHGFEEAPTRYRFNGFGLHKAGPTDRMRSSGGGEGICCYGIPLVHPAHKKASISTSFPRRRK